MAPSWIVLVPPLLVLATALGTKRVILALITGIASAAFIAAQGNALKTLIIIKDHALSQFSTDNLYIFAFLTCLGIIITLMSYTGGTAAYGKLIRQKITSVRSAESASLLLSSLLLFDDFFSSITVGCIMRPLTDHYKIPRVKLAFLIDSMAAPLVVLIPISSWIAMITMQLSKSGISTTASNDPLIWNDPFLVYLKLIPFIFYSFIIIALTFYIVRKRISFGIMHQHEMIAQKTGNLFGGKKEKDSTISECPVGYGSVVDFTFPITMLLASIFALLLYSGGYHLLGGSHGILDAFQHTDIFFALCYGSLFTLIASLVLYLARHKIPMNSLAPLLAKGSCVMLDSIIILFLAWTFSGLLIHELKSGAYLADLVTGHVPLALLPAMFFIVTSITSIAIGSSWGTIAVMVPLATPMLIQLAGVSVPTTINALPLFFPLIGAIFAGAIAGDHISPVSSTTVMSSTSSGAYHHDHVITQLQYAIPALFSSICAYLIAGLASSLPFWLNALISLGCGIIICLIILRKLNQRKSSYNPITF